MKRRLSFASLFKNLGTKLTLLGVLSTSIMTSAHSKTNATKLPPGFSSTSGNQVCQFFDGFVDQQDGTVSDPRTGLIWKRCAEGSVWSAQSCSQTGLEMTWQAANQRARDSRFLGKDDWRLPSRAEFEKVVGLWDDYRNSRPLCKNNDYTSAQYAASPMLAHPLRADKFPGIFWSSTSYTGYWYMERWFSTSFVDGFSSWGDGIHQVRLVRGTPTLSKNRNKSTTRP
jgi:hypothetical protein